MKEHGKPRLLSQCYRIVILMLLIINIATAAEAMKLEGLWYWHSDTETITDADDEAGWLRANLTNDSAWQLYNFPNQPPVKPGDERIWLMTTLPEVTIPDATIYMKVTNQSFTVWLDDRLLYSYGDLLPKYGSYGQRWHIIMLPADYAGRKLSIHTYSDNWLNVGVINTVRMDSTVNQMAHIIQADIPCAINIPLICFMMLLMVMYYFSPVAPKRLYILVLIFMSEFLIWMICISNSKQLLLDMPILWWFLLRLMIYALPVSANMIIWYVIDKKYKRPLRLATMAFASLLLVAVAGEIFDLDGLDRLATLYYIMLPTVEAVAFYWTVKAAWRGNGYCQAILLPMLMMAGAGSLDGVRMHFHWGCASDYLLPYTTIFVGVFLLFIVRRQLKRERYLMARAAGLEEEIAKAIEQAEVDTLTQCYNRDKLSNVLQAASECYLREKKPFSLIMLDIDFFKRINDRYGHDAGDEVLIKFAATIRNNIKKSDVFVRWGGEEFILVCCDCTEDDAMHIAERLRQTVENAKLFTKEQITCSIGVCGWQGLFDNVNRLIKRVDEALYRAKEGGRNRVCRWEASPNKATKTTNELDKKI